MMGDGKARIFRGRINRAMLKGQFPERHSPVLRDSADIDAYALQLWLEFSTPVAPQDSGDAH
jgi:hypothetical protein